MVIRKTDGQIEIPLSKLKLLILIAASIVFVILGFWILIYHPESAIFRSQLFNSVVSIIGILFFGIGGLVVLLKLRDDKPGITINNLGIDVNAGAASFGLIKWTDIQEVKAILYVNQDLLLILVNNPEFYIGRQNSSIKRKGMEMSLKYLGTPVTISANGLKCNFDELKTIIMSKFKENCVSQKS
jgi:hypothetical protein